MLVALKAGPVGTSQVNLVKMENDMFSSTWHGRSQVSQVLNP